jgi:hypothetical protein
MSAKVVRKTEKTNATAYFFLKPLAVSDSFSIFAPQKKRNN